MIINRLVIFCLMMFACEVAWSDCVINGVNYPEGSEVNGFICTNGQWKEQS